MAKHERKTKEKEQKIIDMQDYTNLETVASLEYGDEEEEPGESKQKTKRAGAGRIIGLAVIVLLIIFLVLVVVLNIEWLTPSRAVDWFSRNILGQEEAGGFPFDISASRVPLGNFTSRDGEVLVLSGTSLSCVDSSGREVLSLSHGYDEPVLCTAGEWTLIYNQGGTGYRVLRREDSKIEDETQSGILAGAVSQSGVFALGLRGSEGTSELQVFLKDGSLQYRYIFADDYITAVALNPEGSMGMVCSLRSRAGTLISTVTVLDFSSEEPVSSRESRDNVLLSAYWGEGENLYALGDKALLVGGGDYTFEDFGYSGENLTAYTFSAGQAFLSLSAYAYGGTSTLYSINGRDGRTETELPARAESISAYSGTVGVLAGGDVYFCSSGSVSSTAEAGSDSKAITLLDDNTVCVLGANQLRLVRKEEPELSPAPSENALGLG